MEAGREALAAMCSKDGKEPGGSASPPSSLSDNSKVSSSPSGVDNRRSLSQANLAAQLRSSDAPVPLQEPDLASRLALAEMELREHSGPSSVADSEDRDPLQHGKQVEEELERRSNAGSLGGSSSATTPKEQGSSSNECSTSGGKERTRASASIRELIANYHSDHSKSGSGSSLSRDLPGFDEDPRSSSSSSNAEKHKTNMELWELLITQQEEQTKAEDNISELRQTMAEMAASHGMEIEAMQRQLRKTLQREMGKEEEKANMTTQVAVMEGKHQERTQELKAMQQTLMSVRKQFQEEKGDLQDWVAGQEARANAKVKNMKSEFEAEVESKAKQAAEVHKEEVKKEMSAQNAVLEILSREKELAVIKMSKSTAAAERDVLRRNMQAMQASHSEHLQCLKEQLEQANTELKKVAKSKMGASSSSASAEAVNMEKVADLRQQLVQQTETHRVMTDELSELRVQMLGMKQAAEARTEEGTAVAMTDARQRNQVGDLQMLLESADVQLGDVAIEGMPRASASLKLPQRARYAGSKAMKLKGRGANKLMAIEEDELSSMDGASASGCVSSDGGGHEVGDLHDFDENIGSSLMFEPGGASQVVKVVVQQKLEMKSKIEELKEKLAEDHIVADEVKEELAEKEARHASKVARLMDEVVSTNQTKEEALRDLQNLREDMKAKETQFATDLQQLRQMHAASEQRNEELVKEQQQQQQQSAQSSSQQAGKGTPKRPSSSSEAEHDSVNENLWQQLCGALEAKRIAESRVEEFKRAMASMERHHKDVVAELKQQLLVANSNQRGSSGSVDPTASTASEELEDLKQQLRSSVEEKNVLANSLEWKEVQWKSKVENMEMNQSAAISDLRRTHEAEVKELALRLEGELAEVRQRLEDAQKDRSKLEKQVQEPVVAPLAPSWLSRIRCPTRGLPGAGPSPSDSAAYCQDVCWRILNMIQGTTALLCSIHDYKILEATRSACMTWGSAALHGQSVLTLVNGPSRAAWLRKAFQMHQSIADTQNEGVPGFVVRDLGCEEFTSKTGQAFDSSVITAHLPAEPACNKEAALLLIIEPQQHQQQQQQQPQRSNHNTPSAVQHHHGPGRVEPRGGGNQSSAHSEVSTVDPSDSASNIFDRNMGMLSRG